MILFFFSFFLPKDQKIASLGAKISNLSNSSADNVLVKTAYSKYSRGPNRIPLKELHDTALNQSSEAYFAYLLTIDGDLPKSYCFKNSDELEKKIELFKIGKIETIYDLALIDCLRVELSEEESWQKALEVFLQHPIKDWRYYYFYYKYLYDEDVEIKKDLTSAERLFIIIAKKRGLSSNYFNNPNSEEKKIVEQLKQKSDPASLLALNLYYNSYYPYVGYNSPLELIKSFKSSDIDFLICSLVIITICVINLFYFLKRKEKVYLFCKESSLLLLLLILNIIIYILSINNILASFSNITQAFYTSYKLIAIIGLLTLFFVAERNLNYRYGLLQKVDTSKKLLYFLRLFISFILICGSLIGLSVVSTMLFQYLSHTITNLNMISNTNISSYISLIFSFLIIYFIFVFLSPYFLQILFFAKKLKNKFLLEKLTKICKKFNLQANIWIIPTYGFTLMNAMQSGIFKLNYRIFLYETTIDQHKLTIEEIQAIFAHEATHFKKRHIIKRLLLTVIAIMVYEIIFQFIQSSIEVEGILILLIQALFIVSIGLILLYIFRKQEYEADIGAAKIGLGKEFISGLEKLTEANLKPKEYPKLFYPFMTHGDFYSRKKNIENYLKNQ